MIREFIIIKNDKDALSRCLTMCLKELIDKPKIENIPKEFFTETPKKLIPNVSISSIKEHPQDKEKCILEIRSWYE